VFAVEQAPPPQQHLTGLPEREGEQSEADHPQERVAARTVGHGLQRAGLVGVGPVVPPRQPETEVRDEQVHRAIGDQSRAGQLGEDRVVGDLAGPLHRVVHPVEQRTGGGHRVIVRDGRWPGDQGAAKPPGTF
jgi:hypothetical protein